MAVFCRKCDANVTEAFQTAAVRRRFRCRCGSGYFVVKPDEAERVDGWKPTYNDKQFLKKIRVTS